jgi:hypothetical protein
MLLEPSATDGVASSCASEKVVPPRSEVAAQPAPGSCAAWKVKVAVCAPKLGIVQVTSPTPAATLPIDAAGADVVKPGVRWKDQEMLVAPGRLVLWAV